MKYLAFLALIFFSWTMEAQDIHWTQYYNSPMNINPSLTGLFQGDTRVTGNFRRQWASVPVPYQTFSGMIDTKVSKISNDANLFAVGALLNYDKAGDANMSWFEASLNGSFTRVLNETNFLTIGLQAGVAQRSFDLDQLTFDSQFDNEVFNPSLAINESGLNTNKTIAKVGAGLNFNHATDARNRFNIGIGILNFNTPKTSFYDNGDITLPMRINVYGQFVTRLAENWDLKLNALGQLQQEYDEILAGASIKHYISHDRGNLLALQLGAEYRFGDAIAPVIHLLYNEWILGFSYDINYSAFDVATDRNGGPELSVSYIFTKVQPKEIKICPIY